MSALPVQVYQMCFLIRLQLGEAGAFSGKAGVLCPLARGAPGRVYLKGILLPPPAPKRQAFFPCHPGKRVISCAPHQLDMLLDQIQGEGLEL